MSDSGDDNNDGEPQITEADLRREIEEKCFKAFREFDDGENSGEIHSDQVAKVLEFMEIKISEQEMFKIIAEIDPENTGYIVYNLFKYKITEREV